MLNDKDAAVERVLNDLRVLLTRRAETGCPCGRAERYTVPQGEVLARTRAYLETAIDNADRALEQVEMLQDALTKRPLPSQCS